MTTIFLNATLWIFHFLLVILLWTLFYYILHRVAHIRHKYNWLHKLHIIHHRTDYRKGGSRFKPQFLLFYFGDVRVTLDTLCMMTLPLTAITFVFPQQGLWVLLWHYINEAFLAERILEHNPRLLGRVTRVFAWGTFHLKHHKNPKTNYGLLITLWDRLFGTASVETRNSATAVPHIVQLQASESVQDIERQISQYITETLEVQKKELGDFPICPFVRGERVAGRIRFLPIRLHHNANQIAQTIRAAFKGDWGSSLVIYDIENSTSIDAFFNLSTTLNEILQIDGLVCIPIHPADNFQVNGVFTRKSPYPLLLTQSARQVLKARGHLEKTDYYHFWSESDWDIINKQFGRFLNTAFPEDFREHLMVSPLIEILGGREVHSFLETYMIITDDGRVFSRTLKKSPRSWFTAIQKTGVGLVRYDGKMIRVRGIKIQYDELLNNHINQVYLEKYQDPEDVPFVQVLVQPEYGYYTMEFYFDGIVREHEALQWTGGNENHPAIITWGNS